MVYNKGSSINNAVHLGVLKKLFPQGKVIKLYPNLVWECILKPTPLSAEYRLRLVYNKGNSPKVFIIGGRLSLGKAKKLPHVYSAEKQQLCLHYPPERSWTSMKNIATTLIPWASEWLYHYEIWLVTGQWNGGGILHCNEDINQAC